MLQFRYKRSYDRSTTRSQSHHNALRPFYSFVTTSYNPSTTLYNAFTIPSTVSFTTSYNPSTTLFDTFTIPSQRSTTRSQSLLQFRYNAIQPFNNRLKPFSQQQTTLLQTTTTLL